MSRSNRHLWVVAGASLFTSTMTLANNDDLVKLKQQVALLEQKIAKLDAQGAEEPKKDEQNGIHVGGAIRFNYSLNSYDDDSEHRLGDFDFDLFRVNFSGELSGVGMHAEIRFLDYMRVIKHAYMDYDFSAQWQGQLGLTAVPFGNTSSSSHSYFMSPHYFIGLEQDHDMGVVFHRQMSDNWQLDLGFFKNDDHGGIDGGAQDRQDRFSVDILGVREQQEGIWDAPQKPLAEYNTFVGRYIYQLDHTFGKTEFGVSALHGGLHNGVSREGDYVTWAAHASTYMDRWQVHLQHAEYDYQLDDVSQVVIGANAMYDTMASSASTFNVTVSYDLPVQFGPVTDLQFYNDLGIVYNKADNTHNTWMNITGVSVAAGGFFTYIDLVHGKNQPFIGGSMAGDCDSFERRLNLNIGYYF